MQYLQETIPVTCSDRTTMIVAATNVAGLTMPWAFTLTDVQASLVTAASSGTFTVDINADGTSLLSTKLTIDAGETSSQTAATGYALVAATATTVRAKEIVLDKGSIVTIDVDDDAAGDAAGLIVYLIGFRHL
jgi:hypothetical protein